MQFYMEYAFKLSNYNLQRLTGKTLFENNSNILWAIKLTILNNALIGDSRSLV